VTAKVLTFKDAGVPVEAFFLGGRRPAETILPSHEWRERNREITDCMRGGYNFHGVFYDRGVEIAGTRRKVSSFEGREKASGRA
jgi:hypothetical protein